MKRTNKLLTWILAVTLLLCSLAFVGCVENPTKPQQLTQLILPTLKQDQVAVIIKNSESDYVNYVVTLSEDMLTVEDVLQHLKDNGLVIDWDDSQYGKKLNAIGKILPDAGKNQFIAFFTSVESDKGNWAGVFTYTIGDVQVVSAQVGVSDAKVESGAVYYFEMSTY